jgi:regulator of nonsense transcripts 1
MQESIVRSDELPSDPLALERVLLGSNVVLCTLSTLSNPQLESAGVYNLIPVERLVIDEASQIDVFEYMVGVSVWVA